MVIIYLCCILVFLVFSVLFFNKKKYLHVMTFISIGIFFPILLYEFNWSKLIDTSYCNKYVYIVVTLTIISIFYSLFFSKKEPNKLKKHDKIIFTKFGSDISHIINIVFIFLYLLENYMGSGTIVPGLVGIDIHNKYSAPIISYITNASFLFIAYDFLAYKATKNKKFLLYLIIVLSIPIITRSARFVMVISLIQLLCLYILFEKEKKEKSKLEIRKSKKRNKLIFIFLVISAILLNVYTNYRMSGYGKYDITYSTMTQWSGPESLEVLSPIYGYFALSFNNLKINVAYRNIKHNYLGIYSFSSLYFGVFQIDNLFGVDSSGHVRNNLITNGSANVPTGFWDFYYDYGLLFFIPFIVALTINSYLLNKSSIESKKICFRVMYCWYIVFFAFMSFQNSLFMPTSLISGIITYIIIKLSFNVKNDEIIEKG